MSMQDAWRYCQKCHVMFFDGYPGTCPTGGGHEAQGFMFFLPYDLTETTASAWRYCQKCHVMFFDGYPDKGTVLQVVDMRLKASCSSYLTT